MDPISLAASIVTIVGGVAGGITWLVRRPKPNSPTNTSPSPSTPLPAPPVVPVDAAAVAQTAQLRRERAARRIVTNSSALAEHVHYFAAQTRVPRDFDERKAAVLARLKEFRDEIKPLLLDLGDVEIEEQVRGLYHNLDLKLPTLLEYRPVFIITMNDEEPTPSWAEQYAPFRAGIDEFVEPLAAMSKVVAEVREGAPSGTWTATQVRQIKSEYYATGGARCPLDNALLRVTRTFSIPEAELTLVFCPNCQRSAERV